MIDKLLEPLLAPWRFLRSKVFQIKMVPNQLKGELGRAQGELGAIKSDLKSYRQDAEGVQGLAATRPAEKKMGLFSKKKRCPTCRQKLHATWDECPYCGWGKAGSAQPSIAAPAGKQRTMALEAGGSPSGVASLGWIIPLEGKQQGELFQVRGRITVGTSSDNDIVLSDPSISGHHAEIVGQAGGFRLNDLGSTNGTFVNDKRVNTHDLIDNDNVRLGRVNFKFKSMA